MVLEELTKNNKIYSSNSVINSKRNFLEQFKLEDFVHSVSLIDDYKRKQIYYNLIKKLKKSKNRGILHHIPLKIIKIFFLRLVNKYFILDKFSRSEFRTNLISSFDKSQLDNLEIAILIHDFNYNRFSFFYDAVFKNSLHPDSRVNSEIKTLELKDFKQPYLNNDFRKFFYLIKYNEFNNLIRLFFNSLEIALILIALNITDRNYNFTQSIYYFTQSIYSRLKSHLPHDFKLLPSKFDEESTQFKSSSTNYIQGFEEKLKFGIQTVKIDKIIQESKDIKTFIFNMKRDKNYEYSNPQAGQFIMMWVPGVDEKPMSISGYDDEGNWSITVKKIGDCTKKIHELEIGDYIGIRGPLGNHFILPNENKKKIILIGGGIGMAPLKCLAEELKRKNLSFVIIEGVTCNNSIIFKNYFENYKENLDEIIYCTNDGGYGMKGNTPEIFKDYLLNYSDENLSNFKVYTCGPEKMIYEIYKICEKYKIDLQASLERTMRCGSGICGLCAIDPLGLLVCKDGPIFSLNVLRDLEDFGKFKRDITGTKILI